jgi:WD40 repeat protein
LRRIKIHLLQFVEHWACEAAPRNGINAFARPFCDVRVLASIAVALITLVKLAGPEPALKLPPSLVARGERGAQVTSFAYSPTGEYIATSNTNGRVTLRAPANGWDIERFFDFRGYPMAVAFSPDGQSLAVVGISRRVCVWDLNSQSKKPAKIIVLPIRSARRVLFSPDGQSLAVTTDLDGTMFLCDLATQRVRMVLHHPSPVTNIAFSPDGRDLAAAGSRDPPILIWDLQARAPWLSLEDGPSVVTALAFSPDGTRLASARSSEHHVCLWDLHTRQVCRAFVGHARSVISVAFSPDGLLLATAGNDGALGLWTVATGQRRVRLDAQATWLQTVAFSADGRTLVLATGNDDDLRLWDVVKLLGGHREQTLR